MVGLDKEDFPMHTALLCEASPYFTASVTEEWKEGRERRVPMIEDEPAIIELYVQWLCTRQIFSRRPMPETENIQEELLLLVKSFVLGEKLQDCRFRDAIIDALIACVGTEAADGFAHYPSIPIVNLAYEGTPESSPLRRLLVDMYFFNGTLKWASNRANPDFLTDLVRELLGDRSRGAHLDPTKPGGTSCLYHQHTSSDACLSRHV